ncbi:hypothetical protein D3C80_2215310 [compost metagenome]
MTIEMTIRTTNRPPLNSEGLFVFKPKIDPYFYADWLYKSSSSLKDLIIVSDPSSSFSPQNPA